LLAIKSNEENVMQSLQNYMCEKLSLANEEEADKTIAIIVNYINKAIRQGIDVTFGDLGKFSYKDMPQRNGRNPYSGESIVVPPKTKPIFKFNNYFKKNVSESIKKGDITSDFIVMADELPPPPLVIDRIWVIYKDNQTLQITETNLKNCGITPDTFVWDENQWRKAIQIPQLNFLFS
jgi:DNA-binding protein HU-beta